MGPKAGLTIQNAGPLGIFALELMGDVCHFIGLHFFEAGLQHIPPLQHIHSRCAHPLIFRFMQKRSIADWRRRLVREMWECQPELNAPQFLAMGKRGRATYVRNRRRYQSLLRRVQVWAGNLAPRLS